MRIRELIVKDYNVIREAGFYNLGDLVVVAGPNGVGKTKIKDSICYIFQNAGNPPSNSSVVLEATNEEEVSNWGEDAIKLPKSGWWEKFFKSPSKKIKTKARLIQIESDRQIESMNFQNVTLGQIGDPNEEEADPNYPMQKVKDRFQDIIKLLLKQETKFLMDYGSKIREESLANPGNQILVQPIIDPAERFEQLFENLLYPKKMAHINPSSSRIIQYYDEDGNLRDISELSSGEKEVIILAFDILMQDPSDCIILIDEPELHLHPELTFRLIKVLRSIGERNQIFLFTHSTDIISSSFESGVYFIRPKKTISGDQVLKVSIDNIEELINLPNLRETIGMISLGKKLLFVEGTGRSIDRNVFATISRSENLDLAIIPSDSCHNINNLSLICNTLEKGILGINLLMCRDRDSLTDEEVKIFTEKSKGRLIFLPFYHIENVFLDPGAIFKIAQENGSDRTLDDIKNKLAEFAKEEIAASVIRYVVNEIRFKAGNFDSSPKAELPPEGTDEQMANAIKLSCDENIKQYNDIFSENFIKERVKYWHERFNRSIVSGWSEDARIIFYGKGLLNRIQDWLFKGKKIIIWEQIANNKSDECLAAIKPLRDILANIK